METLHDKDEHLAEIICARLKRDFDNSGQIHTGLIAMQIYKQITKDENVPKVIELATVEGIKSYIRKEIRYMKPIPPAWGYEKCCEDRFVVIDGETFYIPLDEDDYKHRVQTYHPAYSTWLSSPIEQRVIKEKI